VGCVVRCAVLLTEVRGSTLIGFDCLTVVCFEVRRVKVKVKIKVKVKEANIAFLLKQKLSTVFSMYPHFCHYSTSTVLLHDQDRASITYNAVCLNFEEYS
jgi:hypothetical protein